MKKESIRNVVLSFTFVILIFSACGQNVTLPNNKPQKTGTILKSIDTSKISIVGLPCPNSSTRAGGPWSCEEAGKRKNEIYDMQLSVKYKNWTNPTLGGAVHINKNDQIEVYQFWLGIFHGKNDSAVYYGKAPKDTSVIVTSDELWQNVSGIGFGNETSVLITSEYDLRRSESFKKVMSELWKPGVQLYYLTIYIIGVNPYVLLPAALLKYIFQKAGKDKGAIPVRLKIKGKEFIQNLVKYSGKWRLYLNTPMRKAAGKDVGDMIEIQIDLDPKPRITPMHPKLKKAFKENKDAKIAFDKLSPSRQKEILRYINSLKSEESVDKNVQRAISHLNNQ
jgi:hypothetical protein